MPSLLLADRLMDVRELSQPSRLCRREFRPVAKILLRSGIRFRCAALLVVRTQFIAVGPSSQSLSHELDHGAPQDHGQSEQREHEEERNQQRSPQAAGSSHPDRRHFGGSADRRARAASLRRSGSLLARASPRGIPSWTRLGVLVGKRARAPWAARWPRVYRLRDGAEVGVRVGTGEAGVGAGPRGRAGGGGAAGRRSGTPNCDRNCGRIQPATRRVVRAVITDLGLMACLRSWSSPDSQGTACPLSGRNSIYRPADSETSSLARRGGQSDQASGPDAGGSPWRYRLLGPSR
jgi:hypothetical protein